MRPAWFGLWVVLGLSVGGATASIATAQTAPDGAAQGIVGAWQGMLPQDGGSPVRMVLKIDAAKPPALSATLYLIDAPAHREAKEITFTNGELHATFGGFNDGDAVLTGHLASDSRSIAAVWKMTKAFVLERATPETAWVIPEEPKPLAAMDPKADPSFEVATVKPADPAENPGNRRYSIDSRAHVTISNMTVQHILNVVYGVQNVQIAGLPKWATEERFDISAQPDTPGRPNDDQLAGMVKKLLADRFGLKLHTTEREMPAFVLSVAKGGPKMKVNPPGASGRSLNWGRGTLRAGNVSAAAIAQWMQSSLLDRPVVDRTGLGDQHFNFTLTWQMDDDQAMRLGMQRTSPSDPNDSAPPLITALQEQLGLRLESTKADVPILVIDHIDRPTAN